MQRLDIIPQSKETYITKTKTSTDQNLLEWLEEDQKSMVIGRLGALPLIVTLSNNVIGSKWRIEKVVDLKLMSTETADVCGIFQLLPTKDNSKDIWVIGRGTQVYVFDQKGRLTNVANLFFIDIHILMNLDIDMYLDNQILRYSIH